MFYWQPTVFSKNSLVPFERRLLIGDPMRQEFFTGAYKRMAAVAGANGIIDISGILNGRRQLDFIDPYHVNESANEIVADRMVATPVHCSRRWPASRRAAPGSQPAPH